MNETRFFHKDIELKHNGFFLRKEEVAERFPGLKVVSLDSLDVWAGYNPLNSCADQLPVTRLIHYKTNGSKHKCDARCRHAKGNNCECSCGGQFHGIEE